MCASDIQLLFVTILGIACLWLTGANLNTNATVTVITKTIWNSCHIFEPGFYSAPWTTTIRRWSPSGDVAHFPATVINERTLLTSMTKYIVAPGLTWRSCAGSSYAVLDGAGKKLGMVEQVVPHPNLVRHGKNAAGQPMWMRDEYNLVLLHLDRPLNFSASLAPVCLPGTGHGQGQDVRELISRARGGTASGWSFQNPASPSAAAVTLNIQFRSDEECGELWRLGTELPFKNRVCGYNTAVGTPTNEGKHCIYWGSGIIVRSERGRGPATLVGFTNRFFSNIETNRCDQGALQYISVLDGNALSWIRRGIACGPSQFACSGHNGRCIPLQKLCDGQRDCPDGGDEDDRICEPRNCCNPSKELACGLTGPCISAGSGAANCNGVIDCPNGEDEDPELCTTTTGDTVDTGGPRETWQFVLVAILGVTITAGLTTAVYYLVHRWRTKFLAKEHIDAFLNGNGDGKVMQAEGNGTLDVRRLKYDTAYEYDEGACVLGSHLGDGRFGPVRLATLNGKLVAVKTRHPNHADVLCFIALLAELKMMLYIEKEGGHENIVRLVGANTKHLRTHKLQVAIEYCENGSLETFLQSQRHKFQNTSVRSMDQFTSFVNLNAWNGHDFTSVDLVKWSMQIAQGMQFLSSRRIVHSDLAARNILLDEGFNAKICDFGLSHQLFGCSNAYTTTTRLDFPWRWAAPEALETMGRVYNLKSDVWSFGILLWEIFSLGQLPWPKMENPGQLLARLHEKPFKCPAKPSHCPNDDDDDEVYELMRSCWKLVPDQRPGFETLTSQLQDIFDKMCCTIQETCLDQLSDFADEDKPNATLDVVVGLEIALPLAISSPCPNPDQQSEFAAAPAPNYLALDTCFVTE